MDKIVVGDKLGNNLSYLMEETNTSAILLSRNTNLPLSSIKKIRNGSNPNPTIATLLPIAQYFKITLEELVEADIFSKQELVRNKKNKIAIPLQIPVIKWEDILSWPNNSLDVSDHIYAEPQISNYSYALRVNVEDWKYFTLGSLLLVDPQVIPSHRDYVIVYKSGRSCPSLKQILIEEDKVFLQSVSISNNIDLLTYDYQILGVALEMRQSLKRNPISNK